MSEIPINLNEETTEIGIESVPEAPVMSNNYNDLTNKPKINNVELSGNKTGSQLGLVNAEQGKGLSSNDYSNEDKAKVQTAVQPNAISDMATKTWVEAKNYITNAVNNLLNYFTKTEVNTLLGNKQDTLVSGTNIKTVNNQSLMGSGNISVGGDVQSVNGKTGVVVLDANDVGALPSSTSIPTKTSDLTNDGDGTNPFLTTHQSLANYSTTAEMNTAIANHHDSTKQDTLPSVTNDRYLHTNSSTGALEWSEVSGGVTDVKVNNTSVVTDGVAIIPKAEVDDTNLKYGVVALRYNSGLQIGNDGRMEVMRADDWLIEHRAWACFFDCSRYDTAVRYAIASVIGSGDAQNNRAYTDTEKQNVWTRFSIIKTTMDSVAVANAQYFLGEQTSVSITMPSSANVGNEILVTFSSGATPCALTCNLQGFSFVPKANKTSWIKFTYCASDNWLVETKEG